MIKIGLCGIGRMGSLIEQNINKFYSDKALISAKFSSNNSKEQLKELCANSEVIIDFSNPHILPELIENCRFFKNKLVIGTTGLEQNHFDLITNLSKYVPVIYAQNTSIGGNLIAKLATQAAKLLGPDYDIEITDFHHRHKKDAPSGTALMIGKSITDNLNLSGKKIHYSSIRAGGVYGEHKVIFASDDEVISINHYALNREIFANGAIKAAFWLANQDKGLYSMEDIINNSINIYDN